MDIYLAGSRPTRRASSDWFTGTVWQDPINTPPAPARVNSARVAFEPGARTAWHTHPLGQTLFVVSRQPARGHVALDAFKALPRLALALVDELDGLIPSHRSAADRH